MGVSLPWSSNYPTAIDDQVTNFPTVTDTVHDVLASHVNELASAVVALENVLGGLRSTPIDPTLSPSNGDILVFNNVSGRWESSTLSAALTFPILAPDGSIANPTYSFSSDPGMGITRQDPFWAVVDNNSPIMALRQEVDASGNGEGAAFFVNINQPGAPAVGWTALKINVTATADTGTGTKRFVEIEGTTGSNAFEIYAGSAAGVVRNLGGTEATPGYSRISSPTDGIAITGSLVSMAVGGVGILRARAASVEVVPVGTAAAAALYFNGDVDTGFFWTNTNQFGATAGSVNIMRWGNAQVFLGVNGSAAAPAVTRLTDSDSGLFWPTGDTAAISGGGVEVARFQAISGLNPQVLVPNGSNGSPSISFVNDPDTGFYRTTDNEIRVSAGGTQRVAFNTSALFPMLDNTITLGTSSLRWSIAFARLFHAHSGTAAVPVYSFASSTDTGIYRPAAGRIGISTDGAAAMIIEGTLDAASGTEISWNATTTVNKAAGDYVAIRMSVTETAAPGTDNRLLDLLVGGTSMARITSLGAVLANAGTASLPGFSFIDATGAATGDGFHRNAAASITVDLGTNQRWRFLDTSFNPVQDGASNTRQLGTSALRWTRVFVSDGTAATPAYTFGSITEGMYRVDTNKLGLAAAGRATFTLADSITDTLGSFPAIGIDLNLDLSNVTGSGTWYGQRIQTSAAPVSGWFLRCQIDTTNKGGIEYVSGLGDIVFKAGNGSDTSPAYGFLSDLDLGFYSPGIGLIETIADAIRPNVDGNSSIGDATKNYGAGYIDILNAADGTAAAPAYTFQAESDVGVYHPATNQLGLAANSEAVIVDNDDTVPSFRPDVDNTWSLGESSFRWTTLYSVSLDTGDINMKDPVDPNGAWWTLVEGDDGIYAHNRRTGKRYAVMMRELDDSEVVPEPYSKGKQ